MLRTLTGFVEISFEPYLLHSAEEVAVKIWKYFSITELFEKVPLLVAVLSFN